MRAVNLQSSAGAMGKTVTQIITSVSGVKKTIRGILTETIEQGQFTKFRTKDGRMIFVNDANVFCIEVFEEKD
jgi:hypothetical protein